MNKFQKLLAKMRELYQAASLMDAYDVDDYLASKDFRPDASSKDQRDHDKAVEWANRNAG